MQFVVVTKRLEFIQNGRLIHALEKYLGASDIVLILPSRLCRTVKMFDGWRGRIVDETDVAGIALSEVAEWNVDGFPARAGWYYQQLIKLAFAQTEIAQKRFVIWDADTIPSRKLAVFDKDKLVFTQGHEYHLPYFETNTRLIDINRTNVPRFSAVAQHMPVDRTLMREMLEFIGKKSSDGSWITAIRNAIENRSGGSLFSEYELFADWVRVHHPSRFVIRAVPWFRGGTMLSKSEIAVFAKLTRFLSFEEWHQPAKGFLHCRLWRLLCRQHIEAVRVTASFAAFVKSRAAADGATE
jgi:hypothetical protein